MPFQSSFILPGYPFPLDKCLIIFQDNSLNSPLKQHLRWSLQYYKKWVCTPFGTLLVIFKNYLFGHTGYLLLHKGFSLVGAGRGYSLVAVCWLLLAVASLFWGTWTLGHASSIVAPGLQSTGSIVAAHEPSCSVACAIQLDQGSSNPCLLHWQADSSQLSDQGNAICNY